jgi:hypothetical protein
MFSRLIFVLASLFLFTEVTHASVIEFNNKTAWQSAVGSFNTITFAEFPAGTVISNQYAGLAFTPGAIENEPSIYPNDGYGLGNGVPITINFAEDRTSVAFDFPGSLIIKLYADGSLIHTSSIFGVGGPGHFGGLVSTTAFDQITISHAFSSNSSVDDMFYGAPVPAPSSALLLLGFAALGRRRGRR